MTEENTYITFQQASQLCPSFSEGSLRWHRFKNTNGFNNCVRKFNRKLLISKNDFFAWLDGKFIEENCKEQFDEQVVELYKEQLKLPHSEEEIKDFISKSRKFWMDQGLSLKEANDYIKATVDPNWGPQQMVSEEHFNGL